MLRIISGILLVICVVGIVLLLITTFKFIAAILVLIIIIRICWEGLKELFQTDEEDPL